MLPLLTDLCKLLNFGSVHGNMHLCNRGQLFCHAGQQDRRIYNEPTSSEIAAVMPGPVDDCVGYREIRIQVRGGRTFYINELHCA